MVYLCGSNNRSYLAIRKVTTFLMFLNFENLPSHFICDATSVEFYLHISL